MSVSDNLSANPVYKSGFGHPAVPPETTAQPSPPAVPHGALDETVDDRGAAPPSKAAGRTSASSETALHRIAEVRRRQGVSVRSAARRMGVPPEQVRQQEIASADIRLSDLHRWQRALDVPVNELLVEQDSPLSGPVMSRARMLRVMKTVRAIAESNSDPSVGRLTSMLETQLLEIMPELQEVGAWHSVGQRRTQDEMGRVAERPVSDNFASDGLK
ncbi:MAG: helix-turn-helix transcriptional regulator [Planctomycetota bacterium]